MYIKKNIPLNSWKEFSSKTRSRGCNLLNSIESFPDSILVTGCQRSGTTIIARIIKESVGIHNKQFCEDDELSDALLLSGKIKGDNEGRHCFQTTYLNECLSEYKKISVDFKLVWIIRNPYSVVNSMMYNWGKFAFNELFSYVGYTEMSWSEKRSYDQWGRYGLSKIDRACMSYIAKNKQLLKIKNWLSEDQIYILDYDSLIKNKHQHLESLFEFLHLSYDDKHGEFLHSFSGNKHKKNLDQKQHLVIQKRCGEIYEEIIHLAKNQ